MLKLNSLRRLLLLLVVLLCVGALALLGGMAWLIGSEAGLQAAVAVAERASEGRLQLEAAQGRLAGPLEVATLRWQSPALGLEIRRLRIDWTPLALGERRLEMALLAADSLAVRLPATQEPARLPADLQLPLALRIARFSIGDVSVDGQPLAREVSGQFSSDGRQHRLDGLGLRSAAGGDAIAIAGAATLDGRLPFVLGGDLRITGALAERPLEVALRAAGPLERIAVHAEAMQGIAGQADVVLTPFAGAPFAAAQLNFQHVDPAAWHKQAPRARLDLQADIAPAGDAIAGRFSVVNRQPGPLDRQQMPLHALQGKLRWQGGRVDFERLRAVLRGGELFGTGSWLGGSQGGRLRLDLAARGLDANQLASSLRPTRLAGVIAADVDGTRQTLRVDLHDATFRLRGEASVSGERLAISTLQLGAADAELSLRGELGLAAPRRFSAAGDLRRFDPSRFARVPAAHINAHWQASGVLAPQPRVDAEFAIRDSRLANQPLTGTGSVSVAWPTVPKADIDLVSGANRLRVVGAWGAGEGRLAFSIDAPQLGPLGLEGGLRGRGELSGSVARPRLEAQVAAEHLGWPGRFRLDGLDAHLAVGSLPDAPLSLDAVVGRVDLPARPALLHGLRLRGEGRNDMHHLRVRADLGGGELLTLLLHGGWNGRLGSDAANWRGQLAEAALQGPDSARNVALLAPAPVALAAHAWQLGPLQLAGPALDWQASLSASADAAALQARLQAHGSRIGSIDGELRAAMQGAWSLDRGARWQGGLRTDIADLGWLAELLGEGWASEGRLRGELQLAGTPEHPLLSGRARGEGLGLRLPEQGLNLARGELDVTLHDNLLRIERCGFDSPLQPVPRALRLGSRDDIEALGARPGRLDISGEMRIGGKNGVDLGDGDAWLNVHLDRLGAWQRPDQWLLVSGDSRLDWRSGGVAARGRLAVDAGYWQLARAGVPRLSDDVVVRRPGAQAKAGGFRPRLSLDITADLGRNFVFSGAGLSSQLAGAVRLTAEGRDMPRATGNIRTQNGRFEAYGQKLELERGILRFNGLLDNPGLDVRAVRKGLAVEPGVQIGGTVQRPVVKLISDPELPEAEKLAWLVLGHGPEQMGAGDAPTLLAAAGGLLGNDAGKVMQQLRGAFGVDEIGIRQGSLDGNGGRQPASRVAGGNAEIAAASDQQVFSIGKRLSANALLSYEQVLGKAESVVKLTVYLSRRIAVIGRAGSDNALDILYTMTFGGSRKP